MMVRKPIVEELIEASRQLQETLEHETQNLQTTDLDQLVMMHQTKTKHVMIYESRVNSFFAGQSSLANLDQDARATLTSITEQLYASMQANERALRDAIEINRRFLDILVATFEDARLPAQTYDGRGRLNAQRRRLPNLSVTIDQRS